MGDFVFGPWCCLGTSEENDRFYLSNWKTTGNVYLKKKGETSERWHTPVFPRKKRMIQVFPQKPRIKRLCKRFYYHTISGFSGLCLNPFLSSTAVSTLMTVQAMSAKPWLFPFFHLPYITEVAKPTRLLVLDAGSRATSQWLGKKSLAFAGTHGSACHTATAGLHTSLTQTVAVGATVPTTSPRGLWA